MGAAIFEYLRRFHKRPTFIVMILLWFCFSEWIIKQDNKKKIYLVTGDWSPSIWLPNNTTNDKFKPERKVQVADIQSNTKLALIFVIALGFGTPNTCGLTSFNHHSRPLSVPCSKAIFTSSPHVIDWHRALIDSNIINLLFFSLISEKLSLDTCIPTITQNNFDRPGETVWWIHTDDSRYVDFTYLGKPLTSKWKSGPCFNMGI